MSNKKTNLRIHISFIQALHQRSKQPVQLNIILAKFLDTHYRVAVLMVEALIRYTQNFVVVITP